jgi:site-specific DNA-methyltransferase (adenine-specific)
VLFFYTGSDDYAWNDQFQPFSETYLSEFYTHNDPDGRRWRRSDLTGDGVRNGDSGKPWRGIDVTSKGRHWAVPGDACERLGIPAGTVEARLDALDKAKRIHWPKKKDGIPQFKRYADEMPGVPLQTVWDDIRPLHNLSAERLGYPTQKPLPLLERIVKASSNENDIVLDAFCGCGTAIAAAQNLKRQWIGIDLSPTACRVMAKRLRDVCGLPEDAKLWKTGRGFIVRDLPWSAGKLRTMPPFEFENWAVIALGGIPNKTQVGDMGIDGRIYPVAAAPPKMGAGTGHLQFMDVWYPVQVKQKDKAGRPDIDAFEAMMTRTDRTKGFFVSFDFTSDAMTEIGAFFRKSGKSIIALTVDDILNEQIARKLA